MNGMSNGEPHIVHTLPGRVRIHLPAWSGQGQRRLEQLLRRVQGVRRVEANPLTRNVLLVFDPGATNSARLLAAVSTAEQQADEVQEEEPSPPVVTEKQKGSRRRSRIAVRGLDRDPGLARRVVERLQRHPGVVARASSLTGRVLVEYDEHRTDLEDLISDVVDVELPDLPGEDRPAHPLDPAPLIQSSTRTVGAVLGLGLLAVRRIAGATGPPPGAATAATLSAVLGLLRSFPFVRNGLRHLFGLDTADLFFGAANAVTLTFANSPLGLAVTGAESGLLLREVLARRAGWRRYEERLGGAAAALPGAVIRLEPGERCPRTGEVVEGTGTASGPDGLPVSLSPGSHVPAGARLAGGPFVIRLEGGHPFLPQPRPAPLAPTLYSRYVRLLGPVSLGYAALTALGTRSLARTFTALLLVNPRPAVIGMEMANLNAASRLLRAGVIVVGTRRGRVIRLPDVLLLDGARVLTAGVEVSTVVPLGEDHEAAEILSLAGGVAAAAGWPWGNAFPRAGNAAASEGSFDGDQAQGVIDGVAYRLGPLGDPASVPELASLPQRGLSWLALRRGEEDRPLGLLALRPRLSPGAATLVQTCRRRGVRVELLSCGNRSAAAAVAHRAGVLLLDETDVVGTVRAWQRQGAFVAVVSDHAHSAEAFAAADLAIGVSSGWSGRFPARADLLAGDLVAVASIVETGARRDTVVRDSVIWSTLANLFGVVWGFRGAPGIERASQAVYVAALGAIGDGLVRLSGGKRPQSALAHLADPQPERWGRRNVENVLRMLDSSANGLSSAQAAQRQRSAPQTARRHELLAALLEQVHSPVTAILAGGAGLALLAGEPLDVAIIGATIALNAVVGAWQERQTGRAAETLRRLGTATARVLRDGSALTIPAPAVVPGDVLLLAAGDRVAADARLLSADGLEVDEATLTGESLPVSKSADEGAPESRVVLEGSDVVVGSGRAVVVAVGRQTRLGATAAALSLAETEQSPLGTRLAAVLSQSLPVAAVGGAVVAVSGLLWGRSLLSQLGTGLSVALAVIPEGLPLLAGVGQVGVARRLARQGAYLRRLAAVEALGRVDVACTDKTGTLTEGRLALTLVTDGVREAPPSGELDGDLRRVLLTAALASPHPDAGDAAAHPTDVAVVRAALAAGLEREVHQPRGAEASFQPSRPFHASVVEDRLCVKGAPETLLPRCTQVRREGSDEPLNEAGRRGLLDQARSLAERGLRLLLVAEGVPNGTPQDPGELTVLGFVGISDPLRATVPAAVRRCREAGVRVLMITGDHPATARTIARQAGLLDQDQEVLTGADLAELHNGDLDRRLERAAVVARATPLDKLRIVESLQRLGHTVAMTGDGVNDAPALRLADVGVAMGGSGTEVARQAADLVLAHDDFATLVESLVEGRGFWGNMRSALGLLLGGNLGELGVIVGTNLLGVTAALNSRQILVVNLITDALPALSVVLQPPEHRNLARLAREGTAALDAAVRWDVLRRGTATAVPALAAYLLVRSGGNAAQAGSVAFGSIVANQLAQTLDAGWAEGKLTGSVLGAVGGSAGLLVSALTLPPLRNLLGLALPTPVGWVLMGGGAVTAVLLSRVLASAGATASARTASPVGPLPALPLHVAPAGLLPAPSPG